jgi:hypothetical protein
MTTKIKRQTTMKLLLCLVSLALVSVTNACDGHHHHHHHHDTLQEQQQEKDQDHHKKQRRLRKGGSNDHPHHHHHGAAADCDEDRPGDATTQGTTEEDRELASASAFMRIDGVNWATPQDFLNGGGRCTTRDPEPFEVEESNIIVQEFRKRFGSGSDRRRRLKTIVVPLYFHVLIGNNERGALTNNQIRDQIDVLQDAFAPDFSFELKNITRTTNQSWHTAKVGSAAEREFKAQLRQGGGDVLNFYTLAPNVLGWATLPSSYEGNSFYDGVCVNFGSLPGGTITNYNEGVYSSSY